MSASHHSDPTHRTDEQSVQRESAGRYNKETMDLLQELKTTMETSQKNFAFACGGSIPIVGPDVEASDTKTGAHLNPVALRWDPRDSSTLASRCKITFPQELKEQQDVLLSALVADMLPATFGLGGKDVYDEQYRKALKLEPTQFSISFCPYQVGIIDAISKILAPGVGHHTTRAELYKLNVYEGPSGHFKPHVDTPRSTSQFGSLVVCLPTEHAGGELEVRHNGKRMAFDWSANSGKSNAVQWAAFYSDCEHEVLPVRSGYRLTLTYNLYAEPAHDLNPAPSVDIQFPLVKYLDEVLNRNDFMPKGGYLGFYTSHAYPHTSRSFSISALKGIDRVVWQGFQTLGCFVVLHPVLDVEMEDEYDCLVHVRVVGDELPAATMDRQVEDEQDMSRMLSSWGVDKVKYDEVEWMNGNTGKHQEMQLAYMAYGNDASIAAEYSYCAIIVQVPQVDENSGIRAKLPLQLGRDSERGRALKRQKRYMDFRYAF